MFRLINLQLKKLFNFVRILFPKFQNQENLKEMPIITGTPNTKIPRMESKKELMMKILKLLNLIKLLMYLLEE